MKKNYIILILVVFMSPLLFVSADTKDDEKFEVISQTDKYYKTIDIINNSYNLFNEQNSITMEVTKEEYDSSKKEIISRGSATVETTYRKLTSTISQNGSKYRYKTQLTWKSMPSVRSYDIIAIGHYASVTLSNGPYFDLYFCRSDGTCTTTSSYYQKISSTGSGASFKLPTGSLTKLIATFQFDVVKTNNNTTIYGQIAAGDYAHATTSVTSTQSQDYTVNVNGISLGSSIISKYDSMPAATATWSGTW